MDSRVGARYFIPKFMEYLGVTPLHFILENIFYSYKMVRRTTPPVWEHRWKYYPAGYYNIYIHYSQRMMTLITQFNKTSSIPTNMIFPAFLWLRRTAERGGSPLCWWPSRRFSGRGFTTRPKKTRWRIQQKCREKSIYEYQLHDQL